jgi:hypothetical protein
MSIPQIIKLNHKLFDFIQAKDNIYENILVYQSQTQVLFSNVKIQEKTFLFQSE